MQDSKAIDLIEDLIRAVETLQGLCGHEPPDDTDPAEWVGCEVVANAAKFYIQAQKAPRTIPAIPVTDGKEEDSYRRHGPTELQERLESIPGLVVALAYEFVKVINEDMTREQVIEVDRLNAAEILLDTEWKDSMCHSADFCDANMSMLEAWNRTVNTVDGEQLEDGDDGYIDMDCQDRDIAYLVNRAWTMAKARGFYVPNPDQWGGE